MLSKLIEAEKRVNSTGNDYYVCTFVSTQGNTNAPTFITIGGKKVLNPNAAAIRTIKLVKCLFPTEDATAAMYKKMLNQFIKCTEGGGSFTKKDGTVVKLEDCEFSLPLIYATLPVVDVLGVSKVFYADRDGNQQELTTLNAVGYSKVVPVIGENDEIVDYEDTNEWDTQLNGGTVAEVIKRNANNNIANGSYWFEKKVKEVKEEGKPSSPVNNPVDDDDDDE